jgi:acetyltransferase-like isoleucine patch superfamily enzyme
MSREPGDGQAWMIGNAWRMLRQYTVRQLAVRAAEEYLWWIIRSWPGISGLFLRYLFLKATTRRLDGFCWISRGCTFTNSYGLSIGTHFATNQNLLMDGVGGIEIGNHVGIGPNCVILSHEHRMVGEARYYEEGSYRRLPIRILTGSWIGANCFIKAGITIGENSIIGACSNVISDLPAGSRYIGSPAIPYVQAMRQFFAAREAGRAVPPRQKGDPDESVPESPSSR